MSLALSAITGRLWAETEESTPLAVVSHAWAIGQFGSADAAIGKTLEAVGQLLEIVGVTSAGFTYPASTDIWAPSSLIPIDRIEADTTISLSEGSSRA